MYMLAIFAALTIVLYIVDGLDSKKDARRSELERKIEDDIREEQELLEEINAAEAIIADPSESEYRKGMREIGLSRKTNKHLVDIRHRIKLNRDELENLCRGKRTL